MLARQIVTEDMAEERTLVVGLGKTGLSCARFLAAKGVPVAVTDSRVNPPGLEALRNEHPDMAVFTGGFDEQAFNAAKQIVVSPGVPLEEPQVANAIAQGKHVIGDIELFARFVTAPVIAITGSNGKSTVTSLLGDMAGSAGLNVRVGGNLGTPVLDMLEDADDTDFYILELSSFQLETTATLNAVASVVLNISADHMDRYRDINHYAEVKRKVTQGDGVIVFNRDDALANRLDGVGRSTISFGLGEPGAGEFGLREVNGETWLAKGEDNILPANDLKIHGRHNLANALAALALAQAAGMDLHGVLPGLKAFPGLPHRMQWVDSINGVDWYNDSKATNIGAAVAAIDSLPGPVVLIAGGEGKEADFTQLRQSVSDKARAVVLIGRDAGLIGEALAGSVRVEYAHDMATAVNKCAGLAQKGDAVLLAPACASFDMYSGFEERGLDFMTCVKGLVK